MDYFTVKNKRKFGDDPGDLNVYNEGDSVGISQSQFRGHGIIYVNYDSIPDFIDRLTKMKEQFGKDARTKAPMLPTN